MKTAGSITEGRTLWLQSKLQSTEHRAQNTDKKNNFLLRLCSGFCVLSSLFILGCASTEDIGVVQWEIEKLRSEIRDIKNMPRPQSAPSPAPAAKPAEEDKASRNAINQLEEQQKAADKATSETLASVQSLKSDIQSLTGRYEKLQSDVKDLSAKSDMKNRPQTSTPSVAPAPVGEDRISKSALNRLEEQQRAADKSTSETLASMQSLKSELQDLQYRYEKLRSDVKDLSAKSDMKSQTQTLTPVKPAEEDKVNKNALDRLGEQQRTTDKSTSETLASVQSLKSELYNLKDRFEDTQYLSEKTLKNLTDSQKALTSQVKGMETSSALQAKLSLEEQKAVGKSLSELSASMQGLKTRFDESQNLSGKNLKDLTDSQNVLASQIKQLESSVNNKSASDLVSMQTLKSDIQGLKNRFEESQSLSGKNLKDLTDSQNVLASQIKGLETASATQARLALEEQKAASKSLSDLSASMQTFKSDIQGLKNRFEESQSLSGKTLKDLTENKNTLAVQIKELESKANAMSASELLMSVQTLKADIQGLTGRFEESQYLSGKTLKDLTENKNTLAVQIKELETREQAEGKNTAVRTKELETSINILQAKLTQLETAVTTLVNKPEETAEEKTQAKPKGAVKEVYTEAYRAYEQGRLDEAREQFQFLLNNYPENEFSGNARFWIGETFYKQKNYGDAIIAYEEFLKKNPKGDKAPAAFLRQGLSFYELKEDDIGKITLEKLISKYPKSSEAKTAKEKLAKSAASASKERSAFKPAKNTPAVSDAPKSGPEISAETQVSAVEADVLAGKIVSAETVEKNIPAAVEDAYKKARKVYEDSQFDEARKMFQSFLKNYPENNYSDNARFWIGETHYRQKNYQLAILAYEGLLKKNPASDKVPSALLKQGMSFHALNDKKAGDALLEKLAEKYPASEQAMIAMKILKPLAPVTNPGSAGADQQ
jgi:tol-pal system protein YbgF